MNAPENKFLQASHDVPHAAPFTGDMAGAKHIGQAIPRPNLERLVEGRGQYVDDIELPRMAHVVYWRSPVAHARIVHIESAYARMMPGVLAVYTGHDLAAICKPWVATLTHLAGIKSAPQYPMALDRMHWQGEPVVAVVGKTRAEAEDALQYIQVEWEDLPAALDMNTALNPTTAVIHPELGDNLCFTRSLDTGGVDEAFAHRGHAGTSLSNCRLQPCQFTTHGLPLATGAAHDARPVCASI
jgi:carbon-monoxide dehydrogenase large subunit